MQVVTSKKAKKLNTKKKKILNVDELNAYKVAYGKPLQSRDYIFYIGLPAIACALGSFLLLYYWWLSIIMLIVGAMYGINVFLPKTVKRNYVRSSFAEVNKFINNMTQILTDDSKTVTHALSTANNRAVGEFKKDISILQARLIGADPKQIQQGFLELEKKYSDDVIFVQYIEQLETAMLEGRTNIETLKDIKTYHNDMKKKQIQYELVKAGHLKDMKMLIGVVVIFILAITFSFGFSTYLNQFAHHPVGWITCGIYSLLMGSFFKKFSTYLFDDSILEVEL